MRDPIRLLPIVVAAIALTTSAQAQNRGVYPLGMSALNSGVTPDTGLTYANQLLVYARDRAKDDEGNTLPATGSNTVVMDMNTLTWVTAESLWGATYSLSATIPVAKNSLTSDLNGPISGGSGLADSYYLPMILSWKPGTTAIKAMYGFLAPTGRFNAGADDNVGSGYWTHTLSSGQTFQLTQKRWLTVSTFEMYELHTTQKGTDIRPGGTFDLDLSVMGSVAASEAWRLQAGVVGYLARQTSDKTGPGVTPTESDDRYAVNALGLALGAAFPQHKANASVRYFKEFVNRSTYEGYSLQFSGAVSF